MNDKTSLIIVLRNLAPIEIESIKQKSATGKISVFVFNNQEQFNSVTDGVDVIHNTPPDSAKSDKELFESIKQLAYRTFGGKRPLIDLFTYGGEFNPWFAIKSPLQKATIIAHQEYAMIESIGQPFELSQNVLVFSRTDLSVCYPLKRIDFHQQKTGNRPKTLRIKYLLVFLSRALFGLGRGIKKGKIWVVNSNLTKQKMFNLEGSKLIDGDPFLGYFEDEVDSNYDFQNILMLKNPGAYALPSYQHCIVPYSNISNYSFFESKVLSISGFRAYKKALQYKKYLQSMLFESLSKAEGFERYFIQRLIKYSSSLMLSAIRYELSKQLFEKYKPKSIVGDDEFTLLKYPLFQAAKNAKIPSYAIQHGGISLTNINYSFLKEDISFGPLPSKTLVWGEMTASQLIKSSIYNVDDLKIVGQLRTDVIPALKAKKKSTVSTSKKTIVFASQPLPHNLDLRERMFTDFIELNKRCKDHAIYWKPHPNEISDIPRLLEKASNEGVQIIVFEGDLYGLLSTSDALITNYSTVGSEAIYFDLELLVFDYTGTDGAGYIRNGVGHLCKSVNDLQMAINTMASGQHLIDPLNRQTYRAKRAYKIDGQVRFRMLKEIQAKRNE